MFRAILILPLLVAGLSLSRQAWISALSAPASASQGSSLLRTDRTSPGDLEVAGELAGLPAGSVRYARYEDLLALPLETYTVTDDTNFTGRTQISGIALTELAKLFGQPAHSNLIVAICYDKYRSNYPSDYLAAHRPLLVLKINGQPRDKWPPSEDGGSLGPYLISHAEFKPSFTVLSHKDEPQIPFGVTRLEFRTESQVFGVIAPPGKWPENSPVWQGYRIARQDCFRCHGLYGEGGEKAQRSWLILGAWAATQPTQFKQYIHNPRDLQPGAQMPAHSDYNQATLDALTAYFKTFVPAREAR